MGKKPCAIVSKCFQIDRVKEEAICEICRLVNQLPYEKCIKRIAKGRISNLKIHADKHTESERKKLDEIRLNTHSGPVASTSAKPEDLLRNAELLDVLSKLFSKPIEDDQPPSSPSSSASSSFQTALPQSTSIDQPQRLSVSGATGSSGIDSFDNHGNYNYNLNMNKSAKIDLSLYDDLESFMADFRRICGAKLANAFDEKDLKGKLFDEMFAFLPNDSAKLFWYEFIAAHGKSDFDRFETEYIANFRWEFQARRFEHLMEAELTLEQKVCAVKKLLGTDDNSVALKIMLFCVPARKPSDSKQITDALNSL